MRKNIISASEATPTGSSAGWLNLEEIAMVEVSSEDPQHPIESAFQEGSTGWQASQPGVQTIRLLFDKPKDVRRIWLRFAETKVERTQQFTLAWANDHAGPFKEIVRQQWNFTPHGSTTEIEEYELNLPQVSALELKIDPDQGKNRALAGLAGWRVQEVLSV